LLLIHDCISVPNYDSGSTSFAINRLFNLILKLMPQAKKVTLAKARTEKEGIELINDFIDQELRIIKLNDTLASLTEQVTAFTGGPRSYHRRDRLSAFCVKHEIRLGDVRAGFDTNKQIDDMLGSY